MAAEIHLTKKDFHLEWFSGSGAGGQHRNKHANCCRITHIKSGLRVQCTSHKERTANQREAFTKLARIVISYLSASEETQRRFDADRVRTYHAPRNEVIDHASGARRRYRDVVAKNNIGPLIEARKTAMES